MVTVVDVQTSSTNDRTNLANRFILIDDDSTNNIISKVTLEMVLGKVDVQSFTNAMRGLDYIQDSFNGNGPGSEAVLLLDLNMPIISGWEFLDRFDGLPTGIKQRVKIFILSSSIDERDKQRSYANKNVVDYLVKPLTKDVVTRITGRFGRA